MKPSISTVIIAISTLLSCNAFAESTVTSGIIVNQSINTNNKTIAIGTNNLASTGAINIKNARIIKSIILNKSINKDNLTIAYGEGNTGTTGSIIFE
jgi:hypothetical protein